MKNNFWKCFALLALVPASALSQTPSSLTWEQVLQRFQQNNPTLLAGKLGIDESKAEETTAYLRPNPSLSLTADQINPFNGGPPHSTFGSLLTVATASYLHERQHKR